MSEDSKICITEDEAQLYDRQVGVFIIKSCFNLGSDVPRKTHQPGLFFMHSKNAPSYKILDLTAFYAANYAGLNKS